MINNSHKHRLNKHRQRINKAKRFNRCCWMMQMIVINNNHFNINLMYQLRSIRSQVFLMQPQHQQQLEQQFATQHEIRYHIPRSQPVHMWQF
jgi:hypothetical protein